MTGAQFRRLALQIEDVVEGAHMGHADFRVNGKIFATLGYPNDECAMVKLTPWQQHDLSELHPDAFEPVKGTWGLRGATRLNLPACKAAWAKEALTLSHRGIAEAKPKARAKSALRKRRPR